MASTIIRDTETLKSEAEYGGDLARNDDDKTTAEGETYLSSAEFDSGLAHTRGETDEDDAMDDDAAFPSIENGDAATAIARKNARAMAAEKRRAGVEARKLERENVSKITARSIRSAK